MSAGIVIALPEELSTLTKQKLGKGSVFALSGKILLAYSGVGALNAKAASELLVKEGVNCLISWGCAAGLDPNLHPGDLVLANSCVDAEQVAFELENVNWFGEVQAILSGHLSSKVQIGKLAESKSLVPSSVDKLHLNQATQAVALDMESVTIARVAKAHGLPFLAIRAIADPVSMDLPKAVSLSLNDQGEVNLIKLLIFLLLHPSELPGLVRLGMHFSAAKKTLRQVATQLDCLTQVSSADVKNPI